MESNTTKPFVSPADIIPLSLVGNHVGQLVNIMGAVADYREPVKSNGTDWTMTLTICDKTKSSVENGFKIRIFRPSKEDLPEIQGNDDIIVFSQLKVQISSRDTLPSGISSWGTVWVVSHMSILTHKVTLSPPLKLETELLSKIRALRDWWSNRGGAVGARGIPSNAYQKLEEANNHKRRFVFIRDMVFDCFYDITGEVVKTFPGTENFTIYITDYTTNKSLYNYEWVKYSLPQEEGEFDYTGRNRMGGWNGPFGQYTLQVTLWETHAKAARGKVREGLVIHLKNVRAKANRDGLLEGSIHGDRNYPNRVGIEVVTNKHDKALIGLTTRRREYLRKLEELKAQELGRIEHRKKISKTKEAARLLKAEEERKWQEELNRNVRANKPDHPITQISDIIIPKDPTSSSFTNRKYRIHCRVIDFLPNRLEDFCIRKTPKGKKQYCLADRKWRRGKIKQGGNKTKITAEYDGPNFSQPYSSIEPLETTDASSEDEGTGEEDNNKDSWQWRFGLLVEGRDGATMKIMVDDAAAQYLLRIDAADLTVHTHKLKVVREKLFVLWGDLEERKSARLRKALNDARNMHHNNKKRKGSGSNRDSKRRKSNNNEFFPNDQDNNEDEDGGVIKGRGKFFEACVMEYGVRRVTSGGNEKDSDSGGYWERMFMLFGTTILA